MCQPARPPCSLFPQHKPELSLSRALACALSLSLRARAHLPTRPRSLSRAHTKHQSVLTHAFRTRHHSHSAARARFKTTQFLLWSMVYTEKILIESYSSELSIKAGDLEKEQATQGRLKEVAPQPSYADRYPAGRTLGTPPGRPNIAQSGGPPPRPVYRTFHRHASEANCR